MYKILFIDEQEDDIDDFKDYIQKTNTKQTFELVIELPLDSLDSMLDRILDINPDAVIVDFMLNEYKELVQYNVPYNGVDLIEALLSIRQDFPCFVMTSFDDDAIKIIDDVNKVYIKDILHGKEKETNAKANFLERIESQIGHYKTRIGNAEQRLEELIEMRKAGKVTMEDEKEIIDLDDFLEKSLDKKSSIPEEYKTLSNTKKLEEILTKVDELLEKVNKDGK
ncbi:MAG TPA: hypothetical protein VK484_07265 [Ferruginibacter sp.]|nr:hypothetical protein [Ferruginibacter sp.]